MLILLFEGHVPEPSAARVCACYDIRLTLEFVKITEASLMTQTLILALELLFYSFKIL